MFLKLQNRDSAKLKLELLIILVLRFGQVKSMAINAISGLSECYCIKCVHSLCPSKEEIFQAYIKKFYRENMKKFIKTILIN